MSEDMHEAGRPPVAQDGEGTEVEGQIRRISDKLQLLLKQRDLLLKENGKLKDELHKSQEEHSDKARRLEQ